MKVLAIESIDLAGSVAALADDQIVAERLLPAGMRTARSLAPALAEVMGEAGWRTDEVELVAVASGPGSFTSLRIGVTTAKALAYALGVPVVGVNSLEAIAMQTPPPAEIVSVALGAERGEVFAARLVRPPGDGPWEWLEPTRVVSKEAWLSSLPACSVATGPALAELAAALPDGVAAADASVWTLRASTVGRLGRRQFALGGTHDVFQLVPEYFRRTAAEEQWERRAKG